MERMLRREARTGLDVGEHDGADSLGQGDAALEIRGIAGHAADQQQWPLGSLEQTRDIAHCFLRRDAGSRRGVAVERGQGHRRGQAFLLERGVERYVDGSLRRCGRDAIGAQHRFERGGHRSGLVVPLGVPAHQRAQIARRVDPVDPRAPLHGVHGADAAEQQNGNAIAPRIEDRHRRVHQPDVGVQRDGERFSGDARIAVRERDRVLLVHA